MTANDKSLFSWGALGLLLVVFLALTMIANQLLGGVRLDLTANNRHTLSEGTKNILSELEEPVHIRLYFSEEASQGLPQIRMYHQQVKEMLERFSRLGGSNLRASFIDPEPFSEEEDAAASFGLRAVPANNGNQQLYFGIAATNALDDVETIAFLDPRQEASLEYDLASMVDRLSQGELPRVGLVDGLSMGGGFNPQAQRMDEAWVIHDQLNQLYRIENIETDAKALPEGLDALILVHPKDLSDSLRYAIDQYALGGGRLLVFVDPYAEQDQPAQPRQQRMPQGGTSSNLPDLFAAWGINFNDSQFVADLRYAMRVQGGPSGQPVRHPGILGLPGDALSNQDVITANLSSVNLASAGHFTPAEDASTTLSPLLQSSENGNTLAASRLRMLMDPSQLARGLEPSGIRYNLGVRLDGEVGTAFPDGPPGDTGEDAQDEHRDNGTINAVLVADTDLLSDRYWVRKQNFFGSTSVTALANNGDLVINAVDNLAGDEDLIAIRARDVENRPFTRVEQLRVEAEQRLRDKEQQLQQRLDETEQRLNELRTQAPESDTLVLSEEQQRALDRFREQRIEIRKQLRQVRRELDQEIETLGAWLKVINIGLMPLLVIVAGGVYAWSRQRRIQGGA